MRATIRLRASLIYCALLESPSTLTVCLEQLAPVPASFIRLLVDIHRTNGRISSEMARAQRLRPVLESISRAGKEVFEAFSIKDTPPRPVGNRALSLLNEAAETVPPFVLDKIVPVMIASGLAPSAAIGRWLVETEDHQLAKAAAEAAIRIKGRRTCEDCARPFAS